MARSILAATSFALALALIPASASAIGSVEESLSTNSPAALAIDASIDAAQIITAGSEGVLESLELAIGKSASTSDSAELIVDIRRTNPSGKPIQDDDITVASFVILGAELPTSPRVTPCTRSTSARNRST
jgi:hypothetical protein